MNEGRGLYERGRNLTKEVLLGLTYSKKVYSRCWVGPMMGTVVLQVRVGLWRDACGGDGGEPLGGRVRDGVPLSLSHLWQVAARALPCPRPSRLLRS